MSYQATGWASHKAPRLFTDKGKPDTTARAVLVELAVHAGNHGEDARPSVGHMVDATGFDERTIQRALDRLEKAGLITQTGVYMDGCIIWQLALGKERADSDETSIANATELRRKKDAARQAKYRQSLKVADVSRAQNPRHIDPEPVDNPDVTDTESVMSRTQNPDVTDSASGCHGHSAPLIVLEQPSEKPLRRFSGGAPPPDPRRHEPPSGSRSEPPSEISNGADVQPQSDTATTDRTREANSGCSNPQCAKGYILIQAPPYFEACDICQPNVIPFPEKRTA